MNDDAISRLEFRIDPEGGVVAIDWAAGAMAPLLRAVDNLAYLIGVELAADLMHQCIVTGHASGHFVCEATWVPQSGRCTMVMHPAGHHIVCMLTSSALDCVPMLPSTVYSFRPAECRP